MSLATIDIDRPRRTAFAPTLTPALTLTAAPDAAPAVPTAAPAPAAPRIRAVPEGTEARGFVLYVGIDEAKALAAGTDLGHIVEELKRLTAQLAPAAETYAAVALAPRSAGGRDVDVVRLALQDPSAVAAHRQASDEETDAASGGVIVDISRKRLVLDGETVALTYKEFELLQYLVLREGRTIERAELIASLWNAHDDEIPNERTIDVHVRRLRAKLGRYEDIVRTVRGIGYRFDRHADVSIRYASAPSPDMF
ncbi:winged helix family transcriptional regulator [Leifsonia sp. Root112D2]|jgi:DNA-binding winged helix-turn-helix (wHTH) protein|uniref:winged helix family transcriptional regulator n=1 Tax=Leifsonia sp. Root112D2 TaxID=1736426 RepID=UPI0006FE9132|nr:winged helix family transcriptional regulator [Leifsonia sp. Root112D2]KQV06379.1 transcriptional regulator [Leifsonia sp. Root112D2]